MEIEGRRPYDRREQGITLSWCLYRTQKLELRVHLWMCESGARDHVEHSLGVHMWQRYYGICDIDAGTVCVDLRCSGHIIPQYAPVLSGHRKCIKSLATTGIIRISVLSVSALSGFNRDGKLWISTWLGQLRSDFSCVSWSCIYLYRMNIYLCYVMMRLINISRIQAINQDPRLSFSSSWLYTCALIFFLLNIWNKVECNDLRLYDSYGLESGSVRLADSGLWWSCLKK